MTNSNTKIISGAMLLGVSLLWSCNPTKPVVDANRLPQDVKISCTVTDSTFNSWFVGGKASENGQVMPANSVTFPHGNNCDFYKWSEQMFLWITSPTTSGAYSPGNSVLESPVFYTVQPDTDNNSSQARILMPHKPGTLIKALPRSIKQTGPNGLPVIIDKKGRMFEVEQPVTAANAPMMVKNAEEKLTAVHHVATDDKGADAFFDAAGKTIAAPKAVIRHTKNAQNIVQEFVSNSGKHVFLDANGNKIESESGQATGDLLVAQNGSIVYYITFVNDMYAYFVTGARTGGISDTLEFPTTSGARDTICNFARAYNGASTSLPDSNALIMELKTSCVEVTGLKDLGSYFTMDAMIPVYKQLPGVNKWMLSGEKPAKLALIGMHVVGSAAKHPEMIWATFEHQNNAPNAAYQYVDVTGKVKTVPQDTGTQWLLSSNAADPKPNQSHQKWSNDTIIGTSSSLTPSNTLMSNPWGSAKDSLTNPEDSSSAASNSEVIAINNAVYKMLQGKDIRKNYQLIGATWTSGGIAPSGKSFSATYPAASGAAIGTNVLANSTMETYIQLPSTSCLLCHNNGASLNPYAQFGLSHVYVDIKPLPKAPATLKK